MPVTDALVTARLAYGFTTALDLQTTSAPYDRSFTQNYSSGTGAGAVDRAWADTNTLTASATTDIDLAGVLTDPSGATITFARVKLIYLEADSANTNNVVLGGAAATQFVGFFGAATHTVAVQPGGKFMIFTPSAAGWPVTAGSTDFLRVANSAGGTSVTYSIVILGASA